TKSASQGVKEGHLLWYAFLQLSQWFEERKVQDQISRTSVPVSIDHLSHWNPFIRCFFEINDIA
ncbi:hypothetical protein BT69DRAFT_1275281, partial [Atractiella rhizophila]